MRRPGVLWEACVTRFVDVFERFKQHRLTAEEAGELLNLSARHFRRQCRRYEEDGEDGLRDKRLGWVSNRRAPESELDRMRRLYREEYADFTIKHFHEDLRQRHNYTLGYTTTRLALQASGEVRPGPGRGGHRKKRTRRPLPTGEAILDRGPTRRQGFRLGEEYGASAEQENIVMAEGRTDNSPASNGGHLYAAPTSPGRLRSRSDGHLA